MTEDGLEPVRRPRLRAALATGAAAFALVGGTVAVLVVFGFVLREFGYGVLLLTAAAGLLLVGAIVDVRAKRRRRDEGAP